MVTSALQIASIQSADHSHRENRTHNSLTSSPTQFSKKFSAVKIKRAFHNDILSLRCGPRPARRTDEDEKKKKVGGLQYVAPRAGISCRQPSMHKPETFVNQIEKTMVESKAGPFVSIGEFHAGF